MGTFLTRLDSGAAEAAGGDAVRCILGGVEDERGVGIAFTSLRHGWSNIRRTLSDSALQTLN